MPRGRRPIPTSLRLLKGNPSKRRVPGDEPKPARTLPEAPAYLGEIALTEWHRVAGELHRIGILTSVDGTVLAAYCTVYERWRLAEELIDTLTTAAPSGYKIVNPHVGIANKALELMYRYMQDLGLTPSARVKLTTGVLTEGDLLEQFLSTGKRPLTPPK